MRRLASALICCVAAICLSSAAFAAGVDELPPDVQQRLYNKKSIDPQQPVGPSVYRNWKPKKGPPWTIGYASSYAGNTWRAAALNELLKELVPKWKKLGLVKEVIVTQSNLKDSVQIQQMRQLVDRGVDALIICCSNPTALNATVKYAYDKGVPTFSMVGYVTSPYAVNSSTNFVVAGETQGEWLGKEIGKQRQRSRRRGYSRNQHVQLDRSRHQGRSRQISERQNCRRRRRHVDRPGRAG